jgi:PilZ domain-containing protein
MGGCMIDLRSAPRLPVEKPGMVVVDNETRHPCLVSNLSSGGAKISLVQRHALPEEFTLSLSGSSNRVRLVWRTGFHAGVEFIKSDVKAGLGKLHS